MSIKLRDLIRSVRQCKTAAEERGVISTECALIRTAIKEEDEKFRHRNVAKLMYIHMLGYPTHFGQMECLKLISAPGFPEKRIGYLALTLLLTEQTEVLTLVTNSLKVDLTNRNQYIQGLSLIVIGNMATPDMARDLSSDVEKLLKSSNAYLRKKAALATIRLLKKEPDLIEHMASIVPDLLKDKAHGVLISGIQLMIDILDIAPEMKEEYCKTVPTLVRLLRSFVSMGFSPEHDVGGIADPFIQVKLLTLLRKLGRANDETSEQMSDVLAQVATNTESAKNAGNAILYECVQTIMGVQSDSNSRVLAINILGRFLLNRDNNIRYVALNSLSRVVSEDIAAVQRHRQTIVECLKDADISIRQRALELIYQLVNGDNVVALTTELLNYLVVATAEQKSNLVSKILMIVERFSPTKKWRIDTLITMLSVAGAVLDDSVSRTSILFIAQAEGFHAYAAHRLYQSLCEDTDQIGILQTGIWCVGEYGDLLTQTCPSYQGDIGPTGGYPGAAESTIIELIVKCSRLHNSDVSIKSLCLNALVKLSVRYSGQSKQQIAQFLEPFGSSMSVELQQRAIEYSKLLQMDQLRGMALGKMPVLDEESLRKKRMVEEVQASGTIEDHVPMPSTDNNGGQANLLDLDDIFGGGGGGNTNSNTGGASLGAPSGGGLLGSPATNTAPATSNVDLLSDIFSAPAPAPVSAPVTSSNMGGDDLLGMLSSPTTTTTTQPVQVDPMAAFGQQTTMPVPPNNMMGGSMDLLGGSPMGGGAPPIAPTGGGMDLLSTGMASMSTNSDPVVNAFDKNGLKISMTLSKPEAGNTSVTKIVCKFSNTQMFAMDSLVFQVSQPCCFL